MGLLVLRDSIVAVLWRLVVSLSNRDHARSSLEIRRFHKDFQRCHMERKQHEEASILTETIEILDLRPFPDQTHNRQPKHQANKPNHRLPHTRISKRPIPPLFKPHLRHSNPQQNPSTEGIERPNSNDRRWIITVELGQHSDSDSHTDGSCDGEGKTKGDLSDQPARHDSNTSAEGNAFESLMEEDYDEKGYEA